MSTLAEIEAAVERLPAREKEELLAFLAKQLGRAPSVPTRTLRGLKAAGRPALEGLPADLSVGTKERARRERWMQKLDRLRERGVTGRTGALLQEVFDDIRAERC